MDINEMITREFAAPPIMNRAHRILRELERCKWGACFALPDMWVKLDDPPRRPDDLEGYILDRLTSANFDCTRYCGEVTKEINGVFRTIAVLCITDTGYQLLSAIQEHRREK